MSQQHSHRCAPCSAQGALLPRPGCLLPRLAARFAKALPWPVHHSLAWCASHPWAGYSGPLPCAASLLSLDLVSFLSQVNFFTLNYLIYPIAAGSLATDYSSPLLLFFFNSVCLLYTLLMAESLLAKLVLE
ncbi:hypothetical protein V6N12_009425 [Hibiscus sabdariffa]|uniref:Uncharacterized protein n=1 Tax=Hibiscus sabdariffa TaxID=183260 RepID=A0ABR2E932_9ROSI